MMQEPTLDKIGDYDTLSGEKKRVVWAVIIAGLLIGAVYTVAKSVYGTVDDEAPTSEKIGRVPVQ